MTKSELEIIRECIAITGNFSIQWSVELQEYFDNNHIEYEISDKRIWFSMDYWLSVHLDTKLCEAINQKRIEATIDRRSTKAT